MLITLLFANSLLYAQSGYFTNNLLLESTVSAPTFTIRGIPDNPSNPTLLGEIVFVEGSQIPESPLDRKWAIIRRPNSGSWANNLIFSYFNGSAWSQALDLKPNGHSVFNYNVGIGTTADPRYALEVRRNAGLLSNVGIQRGVLLPQSAALTFDKSGGSNFFFSFKNNEGIYQGLVTTDDGTQPPNYVSRINEATGDLTWYKNVGISGGLNVVGTMQAGGLYFPNATVPNSAYIGTTGNFMTFGHAGVSEDFIGYKNNTFFFKDTPGGGDIADPNVVVGGKLAIGTDNLTYPLNVNGTIRAKEIIVESNWSDFVFADDYRPRPLEEVEAFIKAHRHLPDIPSEKEVQENGVSLGDTQAKLLQKIEELTLYMIEQKKELDALKATLTNQNK